VARISKSAIDQLKAEGINVGLVRPITVWPFPYDAVRKAATAPGVKAVLDVELNEGQMLEDVKLAVNGANKVDFFGHYGSQMPTTDEIVAKIHSMKEGK
jgi:2-oxoglutarate ferredoxin oxidoreductase subunit alpha